MRAIALTDTGRYNDPGNSVFGQVHLNSTGNAAYSSGYANNMGANLGASTVGGNLVVISSNGDLDVQDPNGGAVQVTGTTTLSARYWQWHLHPKSGDLGFQPVPHRRPEYQPKLQRRRPDSNGWRSLCAKHLWLDFLTDPGCGGAASCGGDLATRSAPSPSSMRPAMSSFRLRPL